MFTGTWYVKCDRLASYAEDSHVPGRQAARSVDKILKGTSLGGNPVEVSTNIQFAINAKVARTLGLTIAPAVLYRVDRIFR